MSRAQWYKWHSWFGVKLAIFLCFVLATGTLAVISNEIDWLANPAMRSQALDKGQSIAWVQIYANAQSVSEAPIHSLHAPVGQGFAAMALSLDHNGQRLRWFFDPVTGVYQGNGRWFNWQTTLRRLHRHLMLPLTLGVTLVSLTSLPFLVLLLSGLVMHRRYLTGLWQKPRVKNRRVLFSDLHKLMGLWSSWLLLLVSITGVWYLVERWGGNAKYPKNAKVESGLAMKGAVQPDIAAFNKILISAELQRPEMKIGRILLPVKQGQAVVVEGQAGQILVRDRANNLVFDPVSSALLSTRNGEDLSLHVRISEAADPLHFGVWAGYSSKLLYFVFGLILTGLSVTGTYMYAMRLSSKEKHSSSRRMLVKAFSKDKIGNYASCLLILLALVITGMKTL